MYDIDDLTEVASLISNIERILSRFYDVPSHYRANTIYNTNCTQ